VRSAGWWLPAPTHGSTAPISNFSSQVYRSSTWIADRHSGPIGPQPGAGGSASSEVWLSPGGSSQEGHQVRYICSRSMPCFMAGAAVSTTRSMERRGEAARPVSALPRHPHRAHTPQTTGHGQAANPTDRPVPAPGQPHHALRSLAWSRPSGESQASPWRAEPYSVRAPYNWPSSAPRSIRSPHYGLSYRGSPRDQELRLQSRPTKVIEALERIAISLPQSRHHSLNGPASASFPFLSPPRNHATPSRVPCWDFPATNAKALLVGTDTPADPGGFA